MKLKFLVGVLVLLIVVNLVAIGTFLYIHFTRPEPPGHFSSPGMMRSPAPTRAQRLRHLQSEHREELMTLLGELREETSELRTRLSRLENDAFDLMQVDPVPSAQVDSLLREISTARFEISRVAARKLIKAKAVLPPEEQRMFFDAILEARPHRMPHGGPGDRPSRPPGPPGRRSPRDSL